MKLGHFFNTTEKLALEEAENPNIPIKSLNLSLFPTKKTSVRKCFPGKQFQTFRQRLIPALHMLFQMT